VRFTIKKIYSLIVYLSRPKDLIPRREILRNLNEIFTRIDYNIIEELFNPIARTLNYKLFILYIIIKLIVLYEIVYNVKNLLIIKIIRTL